MNVASTVCKTLNIETIAFEEDLIDSGRLDSLSLVQLMVALEDEFHIRIEPEELDFEDYRSVKSMTEMIARLSFSTPLSIRVSS
ncbi:MAG: phosphopantetheine-binding protein [Balneolaceae bacterium]